MGKKLETFLFILLIIWSCKGPDDNSLLKINIDLQKTDSSNLSNIANHVDRIFLEENDSSLIARVNEIEITKDFIFLNDASKRVIQFNSSGAFLRQIGNQGRGPGEYNTVSNIALDSTGQVVYVNDFNKILCFSFNGNLINEIKTRGMPDFIAVVGDELWAVSTSLANISGDGKYVNITTLVRYTLEGSPIDTISVNKVFLPTQAGTIIPESYIISDIGDAQFLYYPVLLPEPLLRDTIYQIKTNRLIPLVKLDFGKEGQIKDGEKQIYIKKIFMTGHYLFVDYSYKGNPMVFCADYKTNSFFCNINRGFSDDFNNTGIVQLKPFDLKNGKVFFVKEVMELSGKLNGIDGISNPVLFVVKLK